MLVYYLKNGTSMNFNFYELLKLKKDPFYRPIKNLQTEVSLIPIQVHLNDYG
jgi:hypothetical protein